MRVPIPVRGRLAPPFRLVGVTRSKMNPSICTICERAFRRVKKGRQFSAEASILFADMRDHTQLSKQVDARELADIVRVFQDECTRGIWLRDGIINKQIGDGLMAIFNFPIKAERHAEAALQGGTAGGAGGTRRNSALGRERGAGARADRLEADKNTDLERL